MKSLKSIFPILLVCLTTSVATCQVTASTDKFIRILGLADRTVEAEGLSFQFTVSEIKPNEYKQIVYKPLDQNVSALSKKMQTIGLDLNTAMEDKFGKQGYKQVAVRKYEIIINDMDKAIEFSNIVSDGFKITSSKYEFASLTDQDYIDMSIESIKDAERKAKAIAKSVGKSVGSIINIVDKTVVNTEKRYSSKNSDSQTYSYSVEVTFEMQ